MNDNENVIEEKKEEIVKEIKPSKKSNKAFLIISIILLVAILGLGVFILLKSNKEEKEEEYDNTKYTEEVRIDASLATQPLTDAYSKGLDNFNIKIDYTNTDPAYTKLINNETDLIVVTQPSAEEKQRAQEKGVELEVTPVVNEGFVFYTHKDNPVKNLTLDQIRKIYTGEITNWKELGGEDAEIIAYQRPVNSGSQTGILALVMNGLKMKEPKKTEYIETMAGIIDVVSNYENSKYSIGYSYYYYATAMYSNDNLRFFKVNGVEPNHDTIKDSSYPIITSYYIVTRKGDTKVATQKLKEAMLSKKGQTIAKNAGYVELGKK